MFVGFNSNYCGYGFPDIASPIFAGIVDLHHEIMFYICMILAFVMWLLLSVIVLFNEDSSFLKSYYPEYYKLPNLKIEHEAVLEILWTLLPGFILLAISIPSFALLYSIDEVVNPALTLKVVGHQWYWTYEISDYGTSWLSDITPLFDRNQIGLTRNLVIEEDLIKGSFRLLETEDAVYLPIKTHIRLLITSTDVLHSWAVPSLGIKLDACPGRLNQTALYLDRLGVYYGQCSEICGYAHGFMPIVIKGLLLEVYFLWTWIVFWGHVLDQEILSQFENLNFNNIKS